MDHYKWCHESSQITINHHKFTMTWITTNHKSLQITTNHDMNYHDDPKRALHKAIWLPCYEWHCLDLIVTFLAKLFPQLCSCNWNGNCDLFSDYERQKGHNFPILWPFQELWMTERSQFPNFMNFQKLWMTKRSQFSDYEWHCEWQKGSQFCEQQNLMVYRNSLV